MSKHKDRSHWQRPHGADSETAANDSPPQQSSVTLRDLLSNLRDSASSEAKVEVPPSEDQPNSADADDAANGPSETPTGGRGYGQSAPTYFSDAASIGRKFEMQNIQADALGAAGENSGGESKSGSTNQSNSSDFSQACKNLSDAATKMSKAFSSGKTVMLIED